MHHTLVVTFTGPDRPGIVDRLASRIRAHGGNWEESRLARLAGQFTGMLLVRVPHASADALEDALTSVGDGVTVMVTRGDADPRELIEVTLSLACADRTGIVHELSQAVAAMGANIEELESRVRCAPMSGEPTFLATMRVSLPAGESADRIVRGLEGISPDLMVEVV